MLRYCSLKMWLCAVCPLLLALPAASGYQTGIGQKLNFEQLQLDEYVPQEWNPISKKSHASSLKSFLDRTEGIKVFQDLLAQSNLTQIMDGGSYTILIPTDKAFAHWRPIDWGFYPFSVPYFTESVLRNHFVPTQKPLRMVDNKNMDYLVAHTMGEKNVIFRDQPAPSVNNVSISCGYTLPNGNQVFIISEVLFVTKDVVYELNKWNKDKESAPLLGYPWFEAQFLSHSFLALEEDPRFLQIAQIAPYVSGANYTFFVPDNNAFEKLGLDNFSDEFMASPYGAQLLLNHFVKGRLYDRDLKHNDILKTVAGGHITITRNMGSKTIVNNARITESEVFVYNLGTMYYIDNVLYSATMPNCLIEKMTAVIMDEYN